MQFLHAVDELKIVVEGKRLAHAKTVFDDFLSLEVSVGVWLVGRVYIGELFNFFCCRLIRIRQFSCLEVVSWSVSLMSWLLRRRRN